MLVLTAPMLLLAILAIWLEDGGPVFFRQTRIGIRGQEFDFLKLRSMRSAAGDNAHREYVKKWIRLGDRAAVNGNGNGVAQNGEKDLQTYRRQTDYPRRPHHSPLPHR